MGGGSVSDFATDIYTNIYEVYAADCKSSKRNGRLYHQRTMQGGAAQYMYE